MDNVDLYSALRYETSKTLFTLVETKQDCLKKLLKSVKTERAESLRI